MESIPERLRQTVQCLSAFYTRNTLSTEHREAAAWIGERYLELGLEVETMDYTLPPGKRVAEPTPAVQVLGILKGRSEPRVIVSAHFDTLNLSEDQATGRAPGANDDASGIAVGLETARQMAGQEWENTVVFAAFSGEEQGLCGARALAERARAEGWQIDAVLNYDMVGNASNQRGRHEDRQTRLFSEDSPVHESRELARWIEWRVREEMEDFRIKLVLRHDRFGRGGDHTPFNQQGFTAVRFTEMVEEYGRQHTVHDLPDSVDFGLLDRVTRANLLATRSLASAPAQPTGVRKTRQNGHDTLIEWSGAERATVLWRDTTSATWEASRVVEGVSVLLEDVTIDDNEFAVTSGGIPVPASA